jgi:hypothetical protein
MFRGGLIALVLTQGAVTAAEPGPLSQIAGDWQVVDAEGKVAIECSAAQRFLVSPDGRTVTLTELGTDDWSAEYLVLRVEPARMLMYIEGEDRLDKEGDPVLWWANFSGPDEFRWRRSDWSRDSETPAVWRRCPG